MFCPECDKEGVETKISRNSVIEVFVKDKKTVTCSKDHVIEISSIAPDVKKKKKKNYF